MSSVQLHLALTHVPVILSAVGLSVMAVALIKSNDSLAKTSFYLLLFAGLFALPVFFSGEGAEEAVERLPGVTEEVIERHESIAKIAFGMVSGTAILSLVGLALSGRSRLFRIAQGLVLFVALITAGLMAATAHFGGQVRHTEIRSGGTTQDTGLPAGEEDEKD